MKKISVILIDWSVRESFHAVDTLNNQTIPRIDYEIIWVEYYSRRPKILEEYLSQGKLDKWIIMEQKGMYFKHKIFNEGLLASTGDIMVIPDSDALFPSTFMETILQTFDEHKNENIVLYLDEIRSQNISFYPFRGYSWDLVMNTPPLINWDYTAKKTRALTTEHDIIHQRNYGACMCAKRNELIRIGGFDEHPVYRCFLCGVYEGGWRLVNKGFKELWHPSEFILHTWHPWVQEGKEIVGPNDNKGVNLTALELRKTRQIMPHLENEAITKLRGGSSHTRETDTDKLYWINTPKNIRRTWRDWLHLLRLSLQYLFTVPRVNKIMTLTDSLYEAAFNVKSFEMYLNDFLPFCGKAGQVRRVYYDLRSHKIGRQKMSQFILNKVKTFKPGLVIIVPQKRTVDIYSKEIVEPTKEVIQKIAEELKAKVIVCDVRTGIFAEYRNDLHNPDSSVSDVIANSHPNGKDNSTTIPAIPEVNSVYYYNRHRKRDIDVCFWGSLPVGGRRTEFVEYLRANEIRVKTRIHRVSPQQYSEILNRSKIALSIGDDENKISPTRKRSFEIIACKSLLVEDYSAATGKYFENGRDFITFNTKEELLQKVKYYLEHEGERKRIAHNGYEKLNHSYLATRLWENIFIQLGYKRNLWRFVPSKIFDFATRITAQFIVVNVLPSPLQLVSTSTRIASFIASFVSPEKKPYLVRSFTQLAEKVRSPIYRLISLQG